MLSANPTTSMLPFPPHSFPSTFLSIVHCIINIKTILQSYNMMVEFWILRNPTILYIPHGLIRAIGCLVFLINGQQIYIPIRPKMDDKRFFGRLLWPLFSTNC